MTKPLESLLFVRLLPSPELDFSRPSLICRCLGCPRVRSLPLIHDQLLPECDILRRASLPFSSGNGSGPSAPGLFMLLFL